MSKLGLVLGSGAARGWSHIGVIEALEDAGIQPDIITGTSIGSLVGGVYASGRLPELKEAALSLDVKSILFNFLDFGIQRSGLIDGNKVTEFISEHLKETPIESLSRPFACVATDALNGSEVTFGAGDMLTAIRASISIPGIFTPVYHEERVLIDGGVVNPVPVNTARNLGADVIIAVDINHGVVKHPPKSIPPNYLERLRDSSEKAKTDAFGIVEHFRDTIKHFDPERLGPMKRYIAPEPIPNIFDVLGNSLRIMEAQIAETRFTVFPADVLIRPNVADVSILEFNRAEETICAGYEATLEAMPAIEAFLKGNTTP